MASELEYRIKNITQAVLNTVWTCHPGKLEEIKSFLEFRAAGGVLEEDTVKAAFAPQDPNELFYDDEGNRVDVDGIRYLTLFGVMAPKMNLMMWLSGGVSTQKLARDVMAATSDPEVKTILLHVDSPGGAALMTPELADAVRAARDKKRVVTAVEGYMASGALWVGTAASEVFATKSSEIGSQGVYQLLMNTVERDRQAGIEYTLVRAGEFKALGNRYEKLTDAGRKVIQESVDEMDQMFVAALAENRGVSEQFVRDRFGRGKMFSAKDAVDRKMIDGVMVFDEIVSRERENNSTATTVSFREGKFMTITPKVKAALFATGCIDVLDASDEVCVAFLRGRLGDDFKNADEDKLIKAITSPGEGLAVSDVTCHPATGISASGLEYTTNLLEPDRLVARDQVVAETRARRAEIALAAKELGIPSNVELAAQTSDKSIEDIRKEFTEYAAGHSQSVGLIAGDASQDKAAMGIVGAILERIGQDRQASDDERSYGRSFYDSSFLEMGREMLRMSGVPQTGDRKQDAIKFLSLGMGGSGQQHSKRIGYGSGSLVNEPSVNRRGDHPDALSNLMGRMMDIAYDQARHTYTVYTKRAPDVPDTRPKTFFETAVFQELDSMGEDQKHDQLRFTSAMKAMIQVAKYGNKVALTEEMIIDDDLSIFDTQLASLQEAAVNTVDNSCRTLLVSNPLMLDGTVMFHASRANYIPIGSGASPNAQSAATMRTMHRRIKGFGSTRAMNTPPTLSLHPAVHEEAVRQAFLFNASDPKVAQTDATVNTVRGTLTPVMDAMLDDYENGQYRWWTFVEKYKPLIIAFLRGRGGERGNRTTWVDHDTGSRYIAIDLWAGYAPLNWRGTVLNEGQ